MLKRVLFLFPTPSLDHFCNSVAPQVPNASRFVSITALLHIVSLQERLDVQIICRDDNLEQPLLIHNHEVLVPFINLYWQHSSIPDVLLACRIGAVMLAIGDYLHGAIQH